MKISSAVEALAALAQESRFAIFRILVKVRKEGVAAGVIGEKLSILPATMSFHLKTLSHSKLVKSFTEGRFVIYTCKPCRDGQAFSLSERELLRR